jgi:hypothetical protein
MPHEQHVTKHTILRTDCYQRELTTRPEYIEKFHRQSLHIRDPLSRPIPPRPTRHYSFHSTRTPRTWVLYSKDTGPTRHAQLDFVHGSSLLLDHLGLGLGLGLLGGCSLFGGVLLAYHFSVFMSHASGSSRRGQPKQNMIFIGGVPQAETNRL